MAKGLRNEMAAIAQRGLLQTQEAMLETPIKSNSLIIGIPKEVSYQECRIPLTPLSVALLVNNALEMVQILVITIIANKAHKSLTKERKCGLQI